ncbi:MAG: hypothetical protein WB795_10255 [Candidatus Acidiferrales bacterium]
MSFSIRGRDYAALALAARTFAHLAFCAFTMLALPAADIFRRGLAALAARTFAHRALVALEIANLPAADIRRFFP